MGGGRPSGRTQGAGCKAVTCQCPVPQTTAVEIRPGRIEGGYAILELPSRESAVHWAAKIAAACRCDQELREFMYDPQS
jgi:hypothetical protein